MSTKNTKSTNPKRLKTKPKKAKPAKITKVEKPADVRADALAKKWGGKGTVVAAGQMTSFSTAPPSGQIDTLVKRMAVESRALIDVAIGYVSIFTERGYGTDPNNPSQPFHLTQFIVNLFLQAMKNLKLTCGKIPYGLLCFCDMLRPKTIGFKTGRQSFQWESLLPIIVPEIQIGNSPNLNLGVIGQQASPFDYNEIVAPSAYNDTVGDAAWQTFLTYLTNQQQTKMTELVDAATETPFINDASAFSSTYAENGDSNGGTGGITLEQYNSAVIRSPIAACLVAYQQDSCNTESHIFATSSRFLGGRLVSMSNPLILRSKVKTIFKFIEFNQLFDALSYQLGTALEIMADQNVSLSPGTCPLPGQHVALLLRAALASMSYHSIADDLVAPDALPLQFPYCANSTATAMKGWRLPRWFAENLRSFHVQTVPLKGTENQILAYIPVFCCDQTLQNRNWQFTYGNGASMLYQPDLPYQLNITDLTYTNFNQSGYFAPTGEVLSSFVTLWNKWIEKLSSVMALDIFSNETPNPVLSTLTYTRVITVNNVAAEPVQGVSLPPEVAAVAHKKPIVKQTSLKEVAGGASPQFSLKSCLTTVKARVEPVQSSNYCQVAITSNQSLMSPIYEVVNLWVLPTKWIWNTADSVAIQRVGFEEMQPYIVRDAMSRNPANGIPNYPSLASKYISGAGCATKVPTGDNSAQLQDLINASQAGDGGMFSQILADFAADKLKIPAISALGGLVPF